LLYIQNESSTIIVLVHEIYGINQHIQNFSLLLTKEGYDVICPNLLNKEMPFKYTQEVEAYNYFMKEIGFTHGSDELRRIIHDLKKSYHKVYVVGFSIGATIAWLCSEVEGLNGVIGYYGSRIRDFLSINPICPTMLFFPNREESFNVDELILSLYQKNVHIQKFKGQHGFSDPYSLNYDIESCSKAFNTVKKFLQDY
jgi:dienelactone hydrolase